MNLKYLEIIAIGIGYLIMYILNNFFSKKRNIFYDYFIPAIIIFVVWLIFWKTDNYINFLNLIFGLFMGFFFIYFIKFIQKRI